MEARYGMRWDVSFLYGSSDVILFKSKCIYYLKHYSVMYITQKGNNAMLLSFWFYDNIQIN